MWGSPFPSSPLTAGFPGVESASRQCSRSLWFQLSSGLTSRLASGPLGLGVKQPQVSKGLDGNVLRLSPLGTQELTCHGRKGVGWSCYKERCNHLQKLEVISMAEIQGLPKNLQLLRVTESVPQAKTVTGRDILYTRHCFRVHIGGKQPAFRFQLSSGATRNSRTWGYGDGWQTFCT